MVSLALTAAMTAGSYDRNGGVNSFSRQRENQDYCTVKRNGINRAVSDLDYLLKNFCDEKGLDYEIELVNDMQDYFNKVADVHQQ
ncbi:MAG: hypothetical protein ACLU6Y_00170 [Ruminococcus sp.]